jgi:hypothetical protein
MIAMRTYGELWVGCMNEPNAFLRWVECHPGLAGWGQAIFTALAVFAAITTPRIAEYFADRRATRDLRRQTAQIVATLRTTAAELLPQIGVIAKRVSNHRQRPPGDLSWKDWFEKDVHCPMPVPLEFMHQQVGGMDDTAVAPFAALREAISAYNIALFDIRNRRSEFVTKEAWPNAYEVLLPRLEAIQELCRIAANFEFKA